MAHLGRLMGGSVFGIVKNRDVFSEAPRDGFTAVPKTLPPMSLPRTRALWSVLTLLATSLAGAADAPPLGRIEAPAFIVIDHGSGRVLADRNATDAREPASLTKLMTAYVVFEQLRGQAHRRSTHQPPGLAGAGLADFPARTLAGPGVGAHPGHDRPVRQRCGHRARGAHRGQ